MTVSEEMLIMVERVKPLSESASRLVALVGDPNHTVQEVTDVVECDAALTAMVLKIANSAAFGLQSPVNTVAKALTFLGDKMAAGIALGMCASGVYGAKLDGYESSKGDLWAHSLRAAIAARELAKFTDGEVSAEIAYTAGILHDIGKSILSSLMTGSARELVESASGQGAADFREAEQRKFGTDHCELGGAIAGHWNIPPLLCNAIMHHHTPALAAPEALALVYVVHVGDMVAMMGGTGTGADAMMYTLDPGYVKYLNIDNVELERLFFRVGLEFEKTASAIFFVEEPGK